MGELVVGGIPEQGIVVVYGRVISWDDILLIEALGIEITRGLEIGFRLDASPVINVKGAVEILHEITSGVTKATPGPLWKALQPWRETASKVRGRQTPFWSRLRSS